MRAFPPEFLIPNPENRNCIGGKSLVIGGTEAENGLKYFKVRQKINHPVLEQEVQKANDAVDKSHLGLAQVNN